MGAKTPQAFAEKWGRRTKGATQDYADGVRGVSEAPGIAAARESQRMVEGVQRAVAEGKWQERVAAVSLSEWQAKAINKGQGRIAAGVDEASSDVQKFAAELLPHVEAGRAALPARGDLEANIQRMTTFTRHMAGFKRSP